MRCTDSGGLAHCDRSQASRKALVVAMRSWAGVHLLASDSRGLVTLMRLLRDPSTSFSEDAGLQDVRRTFSRVTPGNSFEYVQIRVSSLFAISHGTSL